LIADAPWDEDKLGKLDSYTKLKQHITKNKYWLVVSRLEPGNNIDTIVKAFLEAKTKFPLVVVGNFGNNVFKNDIKQLVSGADNRIFFTSGIYDQKFWKFLDKTVLSYIHGHSTGGTNPSLLEIMISKTIILAMIISSS